MQYRVHRRKNLCLCVVDEGDHPSNPESRIPRLSLQLASISLQYLCSRCIRELQSKSMNDWDVIESVSGQFAIIKSRFLTEGTLCESTVACRERDTAVHIIVDADVMNTR